MAIFGNCQNPLKKSKSFNYLKRKYFRSTKLITEDNEHGLFSVTLFSKVRDEYKLHARENKFIGEFFRRSSLVTWSLQGTDLVNAVRTSRFEMTSEKKTDFFIATLIFLTLSGQGRGPMCPPVVLYYLKIRGRIFLG